jgi:hypothetical protein
MRGGAEYTCNGCGPCEELNGCCIRAQVPDANITAHARTRYHGHLLLLLLVLLLLLPSPPLLLLQETRPSILQL